MFLALFNLLVAFPMTIMYSLIDLDSGQDLTHPWAIRAEVFRMLWIILGYYTGTDLFFPWVQVIYLLGLPFTGKKLKITYYLISGVTLAVIWREISFCLIDGLVLHLLNLGIESFQD